MYRAGLRRLENALISTYDEKLDPVTGGGKITLPVKMRRELSLQQGDGVAIVHPAVCKTSKNHLNPD